MSKGSGKPNVAYLKSQVQGSSRYDVFVSISLEEALAFLRSIEVKDEGYYVIVETPEGNVGKDIIAIFEESSGDFIELAERLPLEFFTPSMERCGQCGYMVFPAGMPSANTVHLMTLSELKTSGGGFVCLECQTLWCAHCAILVRGQPVCGQCGKSIAVYHQGSQGMPGSGGYRIVDELPFNIPDAFKQAFDHATAIIGKLPEMHSLDQLNDAVRRWTSMITDPGFENTPRPFQRHVLNATATAMMYRFWNAQQSEDLDAAIDLYETILLMKPAEGLELAQAKNNLGRALYNRSFANSNREDLDQAISLYEQAIATADVGPGELLGFRNNLLEALEVRFAVKSNSEDINRAIETIESTLDYYRSNDISSPGALTKKAELLMKRYDFQGEAQDLLDASEVAKDALDHAGTGSAEHTKCALQYGQCMKEQYYRFGALDDLEAAMSAFESGIADASINSDDYIGLHMELCNAKKAMYYERGNLSDLERAEDVIDNGIRVAQQTDSGHLSALLGTKADVLHVMFKHLGNMQSLRESIDLFHQAISLELTGTRRHATFLSNLGWALISSYESTGATEDIETAVKVTEESVKYVPSNSPLMANFLNNLGNAYSCQFLNNGKVEVLQQSIDAYEKAVDLSAKHNRHVHGLSIGNLASALSAQYNLTDDGRVLDRMIKSCRYAVNIIPESTSDKALVYNALCHALYLKYNRTVDLSFLEEAIQILEQSLSTISSESPNYPGLLANLGSYLTEHAEAKKSTSDLEKSIHSLQKAVNLLSESSLDVPSFYNNLGQAFNLRSRSTRSAEDLRNAQNAWRKAVQLGLKIRPDIAVVSGKNWGNRALEDQDWQTAREAFQFAIQAAELIFELQLLRSSKELRLKQVQGIYASCAYALAKLGRLEEALVHLEAGRARLMREAFERNRRDLEHLIDLGQEELHTRYLQAVNRWELLVVRADRGTSLDNNAIQELQSAADELREVTAEIRKIPGYENLFGSLIASDIKKIASKMPLVYLNATPAGGFGMAVTSENIIPIWFDKVTTRSLREFASGPDSPEIGGYLGSYSRWIEEPGNKEARSTWMETLDQATNSLWDLCMEPIVDTLGEYAVRQAILIPGGYLSLFPLHAAWTKDESRPTGRLYAMDRIDFTYAPSAYSIMAARKQAWPSVDSLLAVDNPDGTLQFASQEIASARSAFGKNTTLSGEQASHDAVLTALAEANIAHIASHGTAGWTKPLLSALKMADKSLTLEEVLATRLSKTRLVILSACETGVPGTNALDEVIGLPAGLSQAGVDGIISTLWSVQDQSTAMLLSVFYDCWVNKKQDPQMALQMAQQWMRDTTNDEKVECFEQDMLDPSQARMPATVAESFFNAVALKEPSERSFAHPFHWAAFTFTGI